MKNKKLLYILLPLVAVVWGLVILRVIQALDAEPGTTVVPRRISMGATELVVVPDTFRLLKNYRDPFLTGQPVVVAPPAFTSPDRIHPIPTVSSPQPVKTTVPVAVVWPEIIYNGLIENKAKRTKIAMIRVAQSDYLLKEGEYADHIKVLKVWPDSVFLYFNKAGRIFRRD